MRKSLKRTLTMAAMLVATQIHAYDKPKVIRIGNSQAGTGGRPLGAGSLMATAHQLGLLEKEFKADGIKIEWNWFAGAGPATNEAYASGAIDFGTHGDLPVIVGRSTGLKNHIILSLGRFSPIYFVVPSESQAQSLADLKGKRIAVFKGTAGQLTLNRVFEKYGFTEKDFKVLNLNGDNTRAALATGEIDGAITTPFDLEARGIARTLLTIQRDPKITSVSSFWVGEEFERKYPEITQRVVNALVKAGRWTSDENNRQQLFKYWAAAGTLPYSDYVKTYEGYTLKERNSPLLDEYQVATIQRAIEEAKRYKLIRRPVSVEGWFEPKYLDNALREQGLEGYWDEYDASGNVKKRVVDNRIKQVSGEAP